MEEIYPHQERFIDPKSSLFTNNPEGNKYVVSNGTQTDNSVSTEFMSGLVTGLVLSTGFWVVFALLLWLILR